MRMLVDLMLALPDLDGWYDRLLIVGTPEDCTVYAGAFRLGGPVLTAARLAQAAAEG